MTRKQPGFWDLIQADRVRYFGPNSPRSSSGDSPDSVVELLAAESSEPAALPAGGSAQSSREPLEKLVSAARAGDVSALRPTLTMPGIAGPLGNPPTLNATLDDAQIDLAPGDEALSAPSEESGFDSSLISSPPLVPSGVRFDGLAAAVNQASSAFQSDAGGAGDVLPLLSDANAAQPFASEARFEEKPDARAGSTPQSNSRSAEFSGAASEQSAAARRSGSAPAITINLGSEHRVAKSLLQSMAHKIQQLAHEHTRREVERGFHTYQANLRALFRTGGGSF